MKDVDIRISDHVRSEVTTICTLWELVRIDGIAYRWTDHDDDLTFQGELYESASSGGFDRTALEAAASLDVSNAEMVGFLGSGLSRAELNAGLFDGASMRVLLVNWADLTMGPIVLRAGTLGEVTLTDDNLYRVEFRGLQQPYKQVVGEVYTPECRASFGDARCKISFSDYTAQAAVQSVASRTTFTADISVPMIKSPPAGMMNFGLVKFLSGENAGKTVEIKSYSETLITPSEGDPYVRASIALKFSTPNVIAVADTMEILAGCDQRLNSCIAYGNVDNFRGEPYLPGQSAVFKIQGRR